MELRVLGPLAVVDGDRRVELGTTREAMLLAILVAHADEAVSAARLIDDLWAGAPPPGAAATLQGYVRNLRRVLEPDRTPGQPSAVLVTRRPGYALVLGPDGSDAGRFERLADDGRRALARGENRYADRLLAQALELWHGLAFGELASEPFARVAAVRLEERRLVAVEDRVEARLRLGQHAALIAELEGVVEAHPFREPLWGQLMLALYRAGRQADALRAFGRLRAVLGEELGIEPGSALRDLEDAILRQKPELDWHPGPPPPDRSPPARARRPAPITSGRRPTVPDPLPDGAWPLVGRRVELDWLEVLWSRARDSASQVAVLVARPGMGKTRLATEFARRVQARGATVVHTRPGEPRPVQATDFDGGEPILVLLDDADDASDVLATVEGSDAAPVMTLVTATGSVDAWLAATGTCALAVHARELGGLSVEEVGSLLAAVAGPQPDTLAAAVAAETGGVPAAVLEVGDVLRARDTEQRLDRALRRAGLAADDLHVAEEAIVDGLLERARPPRHDRTPASGALPCPYKGLATFDAVDAPNFVGRERLVATLVARLAVDRIVGIVGASGSGKSSLVRAGLLPALAGGMLPGSGGWRVVVCTPGAEPLRRLAVSLAASVLSGAREPADLADDPGALARWASLSTAGPAGRLLLVVDQFEELVTRCSDVAERAAFAACLVDAATDPDSDVAVVAVVRADYYGALATLPDLARCLEHSQVLVGPMTDEELHRAIVEPARRAGLRVEDGLAEQICRDAGGEPGALPLVSTALLETWARRAADTLTIEGYREAGGVRGAVARLAEDAFAEMDDAGRAATRRLFLRLAEPGEGTDDVRRRVSAAEVVRDPTLDGALSVLVRRRLLVADDGQVDVAHEALLREWPRLRTWLEEDRDGRRLHRRLTEAAVGWDADGRDPAGLYRGARLGAVQEWTLDHASEADVLEREFLDASAAAEGAELRVARRTARRLRSLSVGVAGVAVLALVAGGLALVQRSRADSQASAARRAAAAALVARQAAVTAGLTTDASRLAAQARALAAGRLDLALLLAVQARHLVPSATTDAGLESVLAQVPPGLDRVVNPGQAATLCADVSPADARLVAAGGTDGHVHLYDTTTGRDVRTLPGTFSNDCVPGLFSADGSVLTGAGPSSVVVWDVATGRQTGALLPITPGRGGEGIPSGPHRVVTEGYDGITTVWDTTDPDHPKPIGAPFVEPPSATTPSLFPPVVWTRPGDDRLAIYAGDRTDVWSIAGHTRLYPALPGTFILTVGAPDLLPTWSGGQIRLWDIATGHQQGRPLAGYGPRSFVVFTTDGTRFAVDDPDAGTITAFHTAGEQQIGAPIATHDQLIRYHDDGRLSVTSADTIELWRVGATGPAPFTTVLAGAAGPDLAFFTSGGTRVYLGIGSGAPIPSWDPTTGAPLVPLGPGFADAGPGVYSTSRISDDGALTAVDRPGGRVEVWNLAHRRRTAVIDTGQQEPVPSWDPSAPVLATTGLGGTLSLWNVADPTHVVLLAHTTAQGYASTIEPYARFSPDGHLVALVQATPVAMAEQQIPLISVPGGTLVHTLRVATSDFGPEVAFTPDAKTIATSVVDDRVIFWDTATGSQRATLTTPYPPMGVAYVSAGSRLVTTRPLVDPITTVGRVDVWDPASLQPVGDPVLVPGGANLVDTDRPGGQRFVTGTNSGQTLVWDVDPADWEAMACRIAGRNLTAAEWSQYLPGRTYQVTCPQWPSRS